MNTKLRRRLARGKRRNQYRLRNIEWEDQPKPMFSGGNIHYDLAVIDGDGTLAETTGQCKEGMDISYKGRWGYHPLILSQNNAGEPLYLVNRSGNRPSHEGATARYN